jgi:DNA-directed RNA polymerase III subunit RPC2
VQKEIIRTPPLPFPYILAFAGDKVHDVGQVLVDNGFNYDGKDYFTSGITGYSFIYCYTCKVSKIL